MPTKQVHVATDVFESADTFSDVISIADAISETARRLRSEPFLFRPSGVPIIKCTPRGERGAFDRSDGGDACS
jgi:hypothetical protein